jgi:hypothetical protein
LAGAPFCFAGPALTTPEQDGGAPGPALLARHRRVHTRLRALTARRLEAGDPARAALYLQATAHHAWMNHPGAFADGALEEMVGRLARDLAGAEPARDGIPEPESVLHVLSAGRELYGHTRLCWRWIRADRARRHSVALTDQAPNPVPAALAAAAIRSGGDVVDLSGDATTLIERARRLRGVAAEYDAVVLHVHPYDVAAALAFAPPGPAPVLFVNHADHVFWLGVGSADLFVQVREAGTALSAERRGIGRERSMIMPIPIDRAPVPEGARERARRELGIGPDEVMLLTVASAYKYEGPDHKSFLPTVLPVVRALPHAKLVAAGPVDEGAWAEARAATGGRVLPLGVRSDVPVLLAAADVYLDSFPLTSITALLEAGLAGLPLIRMATGEEGLIAFELGAPSLEGNMIEAPDQGSFQEALSGLVRDPVARQELGARARAAVSGANAGAGWLRELGRVYAQAAALSRERRLTAPRGEEREPDPVDLALLDLNARGDSHAAFLLVLAGYCRRLPRPAGARMWLEFVLAMRDELRQIGPGRFAGAVTRRIPHRIRGV